MGLFWQKLLILKCVSHMSMWSREICICPCSCLTVFPDPAWVVLFQYAIPIFHSMMMITRRTMRRTTLIMCHTIILSHRTLLFSLTTCKERQIFIRLSCELLQFLDLPSRHSECHFCISYEQEKEPSRGQGYAADIDGLLYLIIFFVSL